MASPATYTSSIVQQHNGSSPELATEVAYQQPGLVDPNTPIRWSKRTASLKDHRTGKTVFEQSDVEVPESWSQTATNILAQKYFRGTLGKPERETSLRQVVGRIVNKIGTWADADGYFAGPKERDDFKERLAGCLYTQVAAFNSPVWFNLGVHGVPQQAAACFILAVEDRMESILEWYTEEGLIFKGGSGAGVNLSNLRGSCELLEGGGTASGPVSFMRGADASAGTIKSGGKTRRAAKMVVLDVDHPDIEEFVWCKAREERKSRVLAEAGFDMSLNGVDAASVQYQNANNSVRVPDSFMQAVLDDTQWSLVRRTDGQSAKTVSARSLFRQIAESAWECADPGVQFHTTINRWHTAPETGPITASNPCSEYVHLDNSACNLASINLLKFFDDVTGFNVNKFLETVETVFIAQDAIVDNADYPTSKIAKRTREFRQIGLGYANLGALLMVLGLPYDSEEGRNVSAAITALMTGQAYLTSTYLAERLGTFDGFSLNREPMLRVLRQHKDALAGVQEDSIPPDLRVLLTSAREVWQQVCDRAEEFGVRNSQATVLAPTGTIGLLMDCDTTGIEPDLALVKSKTLVAGGTMRITNQAVPRALKRLGYAQQEIDQIVAHVAEHGNMEGSILKPEHNPVFACSLGDNAISVQGHVYMMAAVQPFLSGAISKTVNMPQDSTVEDVEQVFIDGWRKGLKAVALYRDGSKVAQPLSSTSNKQQAEEEQTHSLTTAPVRQRLPKTRKATTFEFRVGDCKGYVTVGEYPDGRPGEIFVHVSKQGSTLSGIMNAFAVSVSHGLQYGVPLSAYCRTYIGTRFEPAGITDDQELRISSSLVDYLFRKLAIMYLPTEERKAMGVLTTKEREEPALADELDDLRDFAVSTPQKQTLSPSSPFCMACGIPMIRAGACFVCSECGTSSGCS